MKTYRLLFAGLIAWVALVGCGKRPEAIPDKDGVTPNSNQSITGPYSTPEATWATVTAANLSRDHKAFISGFSPTFQKEMVARQAFEALQMRNFNRGSKEANAKFQAEIKPVLDALEKHGLTAETTKSINFRDRSQHQKNTATIAGMVKDPVGLWTDLQSALAKLPDSKDGPSSEFSGKLEDIKIDGDKATAKSVRDGRGGPRSTPVHFAKFNGEWRVAPELRQE
jgi:hypothetical protein